MGGTSRRLRWCWWEEKAFGSGGPWTKRGHPACAHWGTGCFPLAHGNISGDAVLSRVREVGNILVRAKGGVKIKGKNPNPFSSALISIPSPSSRCVQRVQPGGRGRRSWNNVMLTGKMSAPFVTKCPTYRDEANSVRLTGLMKNST